MTTEQRYDFQKAEGGIRELEEIASEIAQLSTGACEESLRQARSAWSGAGSQTFLSKAQILQEKLNAASAAATDAAAAYREASDAARSAGAANAQIMEG